MLPTGFKCARCGACCEWEGPVRLEEGEPDRIAEFLRMDVAEFIAKRTVLTEDRRSLSLRESPDGACEFYDRQSRSCLINAVKPLQCMRFPASWSFKGWEKLCAGAKEALGREAQGEAKTRGS